MLFNSTGTVYNTDILSKAQVNDNVQTAGR